MLVNLQWPDAPDGYKIINLNRRKAIAEKCLNCSGFEYSSRRNCSIVECVLYSFRTGDGKQDSSIRKASIQAFCREVCMEGNQRYVANYPSRDCPLYAFRLSKLDRSVEARR